MIDNWSEYWNDTHEIASYIYYCLQVRAGTTKSIIQFNVLQVPVKSAICFDLNRFIDCRSASQLVDFQPSKPDSSKVFNAHEGNFGSQWLNVVPCKNLGLKLDDQQLRISVRLRLGANIYVAHTCHCGKRVERDGIHGLSCTKSAGRFSLHATLNSLTKQTLGSLNLPSMLEARGLPNWWRTPRRCYHDSLGSGQTAGVGQCIVVYWVPLITCNRIIGRFVYLIFV